jgi:hypothetical protein
MVTARSGARPSREQDEELVVTNADLGDAALDAARATPRAESGDGKRPFGTRDGKRPFGTRPALNVKLAVSYITRDAEIHAPNLRTATGPVNAKAMTDL